MKNSLDRPSRLLRHLLCLTLAAAIGTSGFAAAVAEEPPSPAAVSPGFFRLQEWIPAPLRDGLRAYEEGRFFAAIADLDGLIAARKPAYALDDALFLRALSLSALGWDDLAVPSLTAVIEANPPGPYTIPALLELIDVHDRAGRWKAVAEAWARSVDRPLNSKGSRNRRVADLLFEFGTLRPASTSSTRREKSLLSRPKELAVMLESRRERASDRLLYRSGLALSRLGRHEESLRAFLMIGLQSPYYPYARYSIAQNFFALGRPGDAVTTLSRLERYPKITEEERALESRARVLHAAILFETGRVDDGIAVARSIADDDPEAPQARLLITTALLEAGKPSLALVYDTATARPIVTTEARHALMIGAAYTSLGDRASAARVLRDAAGQVRKARVAGPALEDAVGRLRALAENEVRERRERAQAVRAHLASGVHVVLAHDGPWNLGTLLRRMRATLGAGAYRELALGTKPQAVKTVSEGDPWLAYLASARRSTVELGLNELADLEAGSGASAAETPLRILNGYVLFLEYAPADADDRKHVATEVATFADHLRSRSEHDIPALRIDPAAPPLPEVTAFRRRLSDAAAALRESQPEREVLESARHDVAGLLRKWIDRELGEMLHERDAELRDLELDLDVALAAALAGETQPRAEEPPR